MCLLMLNASVVLNTAETVKKKHALRVIAVTFRAFLVLRIYLKAFSRTLRAGTPWETPIAGNELGVRERHKTTT